MLTVSEEQKRLAVLRDYAVYGTAPEAAYDDIVSLVSIVCGTPIALISFVGEHDVWFKARWGRNAECVARTESICVHALQQPDALFIIEDVALDSRFAHLPQIAAHHIRFYAAAPLTTPDGYVLGTLCAIHHQPMSLTDEQQQALWSLSRQVMRNLELRKMNRQLTQDAAILATKADELRQLNHSKDRFFSIIAHDLKAPFQGMLGFSELLETELEDMSPVEIRNIASYLHDTAAGAFKLLENLLSWAMLESGRMRYQPRILLVEHIFDLVEGSLLGAARHKHIQLVFNCPKDLSVYADENMLRAMLRNLVANAVKFTKDSGGISVYAQPDVHGAVVFGVEDNGIGMTEAQCQTIRQQLAMAPKIEQGQATDQQRDSTTGTQGETGTGLGLLLCQQFAQRHGTHLTVTSTLGEGSVFTFKLPTKPAELAQSPLNRSERMTIPLALP